MGLDPINLNKFEEALDSFEKAFEINPDSTMAKLSKLFLIKSFGIKSTLTPSVHFCTNCGRKMNSTERSGGNCGTLIK